MIYIKCDTLEEIKQTKQKLDKLGYTDEIRIIRTPCFGEIQYGTVKINYIPVLGIKQFMGMDIENLLITP